MLGDTNCLKHNMTEKIKFQLFLLRWCFKLLHCQRSYLLLLTTLQVSPRLHGLAQVDAVHGNLNLANHVVFGETVKVENLQHQSFPPQLCVRDLEPNTREIPLSRGCDPSIALSSPRINNTLRHGHEHWKPDNREFRKSLHGTLKMKVSLKTGQRFFRCTLVSYFFFLSGNRKTLT